MALWTLAEQQMIRPLDNNNVAQFLQLQKEVEANDLVKYLGFDFYQELKRNITDYAVLLNGGSYTYNGYTYTFSGLKVVCAYLLYARYVRSSYIIDTFSGFMVHTTDNMQRVSSGEIQNQENRYKEIAGTAWNECLKYIDTLSIPWFTCSKSKQNKIDYL